MRLLSTVLAASVSVAAFAAAVSPTLPAPEWPDCEAVTNAALPVATWQRRGLGLRVSLDRDGAPTGLVATNETGGTVFSEWRHAPPAWSFDPSWDTVRVVSAGPDDADGRVRVEIGPDGTLFIMR